MEVVSLSPFRCASLLWQPKPNAWVLTIVCKATYLLRPAEATLAPEQEEPNEDDNYWDDNPGRSLQSASDLVPVKPRVDVTLIGHAFAPEKQPVRSLIARMIVGEIDKSIEIACDRTFSLDGQLVEGPRFSRMRVVYERATGGLDTSNPVGIRREVRDAYGKLTVPNLQPPGLVISKPSDTFDPIGFGPIAPTWPSRREKLGRYGGVFTLRDLRSSPLPEDVDPSFFNAAPRDQQMQLIRGNERITLENLHPDHARLSTNLPGVHPRAFLEGRATGPQMLPMRADTLAIDTDQSLCMLTWRGQVPLDHAHEGGRVLVAMEQPGQSLSWADVERQAGGSSWSAAAAAAAAAARPGASGPKLSNLTEPTNAAPPRQPEKRTTFDPQLASPSGGGLPFAPSSQPGSDRSARTGGLPFAPSTPASQSPEGGDPSRRSGGLPFVPQAPSIGEETVRGRAVLPFVPTAPASPKPPGPVTPAPPAIVEPSSVFRAPIAPGSPSATESRWAGGSGSSVAADPMPSPLTAAPSGAAVVGLSASKEAPGAAVLVASNAAAAQSAPWDMPRPDPNAAESLGISAKDAPRAGVRPDGRDVVELVWFHPDSVARICKQGPWREILDELEEKPSELDLDDIMSPRDPQTIEDRRAIFELLARAEQKDAIGIHDALDDAILEDGKLIPPLVMTAGELVFPFDEVETLKATVTTVTPLSQGDENLRATVAIAREFLSLPGLTSAPAVADGMTTRVKDVFAMAKRPVPPDYLQAQTDRVLLEQRHYQRRPVFGDVFVRAFLTSGGSSNAFPTYLPDSISKKLPLFQRFKVRMIVEVHMAVDQFETHPTALRVLALARVVERPRR